MNEGLIFVAKMKAKSGKEKELRETLQTLVEPTHEETGCVQYDLHESLDEPGSFLFYEIWTGEDALKQHLETRHVKSALGKAEEFLTTAPEFVRLKRLHKPKHK